MPFDELEPLNPIGASDPLTQSFCAFRRAFGLESAVSMTPYQPSCVGVLPREGPGYTSQAPFVEPGGGPVFDPGSISGGDAARTSPSSSNRTLWIVLAVVAVIFLFGE